MGYWDQFSAYLPSREGVSNMAQPLFNPSASRGVLAAPSLSESTGLGPAPAPQMNYGQGLQLQQPMTDMPAYGTSIAQGGAGEFANLPAKAFEQPEKVDYTKVAAAGLGAAGRTLGALGKAPGEQGSPIGRYSAPGNRAMAYKPIIQVRGNSRMGAL